MRLNKKECNWISVTFFHSHIQWTPFICLTIFNDAKLQCAVAFKKYLARVVFIEFVESTRPGGKWSKENYLRKYRPIFILLSDLQLENKRTLQKSSPVTSNEVRSSPPQLFLLKGILKTYKKSTGEPSCQSAISIKLQSNFIENTLQYGCCPVNLLHIFRTPLHKNTSGELFLEGGGKRYEKLKVIKFSHL